METTATVDTGAAEAQPMETESAAADAQSTQAESAGQPDIKALLKREKDDPNVRFNDAELDALEKHWSAVESGKPNAKEEPEEPEEAEEPEEKPEPKPKKEPEEEEQPEEEPEHAEPDADTKAILKELGAKSPKEILAKVKALKSLTGGKDAQAVARLTKEKEDVVNGGKALWTALKNGDAQAIAFAEKTFGVKIQGKEAKAPEAVAEGDGYINPELFIDPESAKQVNDAFKRRDAQIKAFEDRFKTVEQERDARIQEQVKSQSINSVVDEMADIASRIPALKGINGFREIAQGVLNGKADSRLDVFTELFEIAGEEKCTLKQAYFIKRGRDTDIEVAQAEERGRKSAYNQKPNPSLSGLTGGKGEAAYQPVTEADLEKWANDHRTHPAHWYDKEGNLVITKVPKRARHLFD